MDFYDHSDIKVSELKELADKVYAARDVYDEHKAIASEKHKEYKQLEYKLIEALNEHGLKTLDLGGDKKVSVKRDDKVDLPADPGDYEALVTFIQQGHSESFFALNKTKLRTFITNEREGRGDDSWLPPGVKEGEPQFTLSMRGRKSGPK